MGGRDERMGGGGPDRWAANAVWEKRRIDWGSTRSQGGKFARSEVRFDRVGRELTVDVGGHRRRALSSVPSSVRARALRLGATARSVDQLPCVRRNEVRLKVGGRKDGVGLCPWRGTLRCGGGRCAQRGLARRAATSPPLPRYGRASSGLRMLARTATPERCTSGSRVIGLPRSAL